MIANHFGKAGFKKTGIFPWDPEAVDYTKCLKLTNDEINQKPEVSMLEQRQALTALKVLEKFISPERKEALKKNNEVLEDDSLFEFWKHLKHTTIKPIISQNAKNKG